MLGTHMVRDNSQLRIRSKGNMYHQRKDLLEAMHAEPMAQHHAFQPYACKVA